MMGRENNEKLARLLAGAAFDIWDIYAEQSRTTAITCEDNRIDKIVSGIDSGTGVRGVKDFRTFYGFTNKEDFESLAAVASTLSAEKKTSNKNFTLSDIQTINPHKIKIYPADILTPEKITFVKALNETARAVSGLIRQVSITYLEKTQTVEIINDLGRRVADTRIYCTVIMQVVAAKGNRIETAYKAISGQKGYELIKEENFAKHILAVAQRAVSLLEVDKKITGKMTAVLSSEAGGTLIHEAVGHSLEADIVQKDMSKYKGMVGKKVAAEIVSVVDDATLENKRGAFCFDDEGIPAQKTVLIEKGILKGYMNDRITASRDKVSPTGNGRRESYKFKPIVRMSNTMISPGTGNATALIKDTKNGIFVKHMGGGEVNTVTGDFIFEVKEGYIIENGKITEPVRDATLMGNGIEVLNSIDAVCDDLGFEVGTCGKDGQGVPVTDAQPTIRIPQILVGSK